MKFSDLLRLTVTTFVVYRMRSFLTGLGIAIGVAAVILLTSIGEGLHQYLLDEFSQFGTNIITIQPGKSQTHGGNAGIFGSIKPLTMEDSDALHRVPHIEFVNPSVQGNAEIRAEGKSRRSFVYGAGPDFPRAFKMKVQMGNFLPDDEAGQSRNFVVLGHKVRQELFSNTNPLGGYVRIGGERYRVIGVMESKGQILGFDMDDIVYIPAARALEMFNRAGLIEINVNYQPSADPNKVVESIKSILTARHGREDYTVITQEQALEVMNSVLGVITFAVAAIGAISLLVGGVGILTIMTMAVTERTGEIGLLRALGAKQQQVLMLFLGEAILLSAAGGLAGLIIGMGAAQALHALMPSLPVQIPVFFAVLAESTAILIGLAAGVIPARRASMMDPVEALRTE
ncbi:MAG: peptide ABC transporter permease [Gallionellales bacterium 35-53-114]|jgi:putative ABC transport system permease protein|nr:MAG: peptide ABC transporter permease [Gallionellales bacterium 35-53-114]OYZ62837.1 MAG: peptide ABC transporter permease [Gallionellales bacterium 24-53-125]OZB09912.1 MAG: peptide ABC transporter permease [Gallionellales bacterium 39-52-133]HQS58419.1 ABC transporter permease [Gallionellaceae bacterium]HQS73974.1 ABC transporter permease [Gallionellaceae bacterium]